MKQPWYNGYKVVPISAADLVPYTSEGTRMSETSNPPEPLAAFDIHDWQHTRFARFGAITMKAVCDQNRRLLYVEVEQELYPHQMNREAVKACIAFLQEVVG